MDNSSKVVHKECELCGKDYKNNNAQFGSACRNHILEVLNIRHEIRGKDKLQYIENHILNESRSKHIDIDNKSVLINKYLSLKYLERLNFNQELTARYEKSINNGEIVLKDVYKVYRTNNKFESLKNQIDSLPYDLLSKSFSFIFSLYSVRKKTSLEKEVYKELQRAFWYQLAYTILPISYPFTAKCLAHSLEFSPRDLYISDKKTIDKIKSDKNFIKVLRDTVDKYGANDNNFENVKEHFNFNDGDLFAALHGVDIFVAGTKDVNNKWTLKISISDKYDFDRVRSWKEIKDGSIFTSMANILNNIGHYSEEFDVINPYMIYIEFEVNDYEVD